MSAINCIKFSLLKPNSVCVASVAHFKFKNPFAKGDRGARRTRQQYAISNNLLKEHRQKWMPPVTENNDALKETFSSPRDFRFVFPDFLPNPDMMFRDKLAEKLQRRDMVRRRCVVEIPEFYVGSILAVMSADPHSPDKTNRFVGICIQRAEYCLRANFTLRNVIDGQGDPSVELLSCNVPGIEIRYDLYNPTVHKIEVLKLEKRLDDELFYLRDAPPEYSTVPFDMDPVPMPLSATVPVNPLKVKLNPLPWCDRWERYNLKGIEPLELPQKKWDRAAHPQVVKAWLKHDLMREYRERICDAEVEKVAFDVYKEISTADRSKHKLLRTKISKSKTVVKKEAQASQS